MRPPPHPEPARATRKRPLGLLVLASLSLFAVWLSGAGEGTRAAVAGGGLKADPARTASAWDGTSRVAHEWGTFTSVSGSDGVGLDGLQHEETDLPAFVYDLRDRAGLTGVSPKMETPVIYFHAPAEERVRVQVGFPHGTITQWFPAARAVNHQGLQVNGVPSGTTRPSITVHQDGFIRWGDGGDLRVLARDADVPFPAVSKTDPWRFCRETDANPVRVCTLNHPPEPGGKRQLTYEYERCLFYRGLGDFALPLTARVLGERARKETYEVTLELGNRTPAEPLAHLYVIWVHGDRCGFQYLRGVGLPGQRRIVMRLAPRAAATRQLVASLAGNLVRTGLYTKEALAMVHTWKQGYFQDEGLRVLYVLPQALVDRELPLKIQTLGDNEAERAWSVTRTFVGRLELLSPEREGELQRGVTDLLQKHLADAELADAAFARYGRFAIPFLTRARDLTRDTARRTRIEASLATLRRR